MEEVSYTLLKIELLSLDMPRPNFSADLGSLMWHYTQQTDYSEMTATKTQVQVTISYMLYAKNDPQKNSICALKTRSTFSTDRLISAQAKLHLLHRFLNIAVWNLQGIYAAKTQSVFLGRTVPPEINFKEHEQGYIKEINGHWR